jgi:hypothetical protein
MDASQEPALQGPHRKTVHPSAHPGPASGASRNRGDNESYSQRLVGRLFQQPARAKATIIGRV